MLIKSGRGAWEVEINGLRWWFINTRLTGDIHAKVDARHWGNGWFDMWWQDDAKTAYVVSIGKWNMTGGLPGWLRRLLGRATCDCSCFD